MASAWGPGPDPQQLGVFTESRYLATADKFEVGINILPDRFADGRAPIPVFLRLLRPARNFGNPSVSRREIIESLLEQLTKQLAVESLEGR